MRIVSLLPSATEIVAELGLLDDLVGVSHCCDYPAGVRDLPVVTASVVDKDASSHIIDATVREHLSDNSSLYSLDADLLEHLKPDLVITQALCDVCAVSGEEVGKVLGDLTSVPQMVNLEPFCLEDVLETMQVVGEMTARTEIAKSRIDCLRARIAVVERRTRVQVTRPRRMVLVDWIEPPFISGHWIKDLISLAGGVSTIDIAGVPSRTMSWEEIGQSTPDVIVVACCGFSAERAREELIHCDAGKALDDLKVSSGTEVYVLDGDALFSRPGPRLVESLELLAHVLHPDIHPAHDWFDLYQ